MSSHHVVVVGAGHAGAQLCVSLIQNGFAGRITLVGDEPELPYHRPPLSKTGLDPQTPLQAQLIRPAEFYSTIRTITGQRVRSIDRVAKQVVLDDRRIDYGTLVLATGSRHRRPPIKHVDHPKVYPLRTIAEAAKLRDEVAPGKRVAIIGGGFIGLESAASLRKARLDVTVLETADRLLARVTCPAVSDFFAQLHRRHGVTLRCGTSVASIEDTGGSLTLIDPGGNVVTEADFVVLGAGAMPNDTLARDAGLEVSNGIVVDAQGRSSDPAIFAIGDCCNQLHPLYNANLRIESVQNATDQAKVVAAAICNLPAPAVSLPWFWSDQYNVKLQIAGISSGHDQLIVRGTPEPGSSFSVWYLRDGRLLAVDTINDARSYMLGSKLIARGECPPVELLGNVNIDLKSLLDSKGA